MLIVTFCIFILLLFGRGFWLLFLCMLLFFYWHFGVFLFCLLFCLEDFPFVNSDVLYFCLFYCCLVKDFGGCFFVCVVVLLLAFWSVFVLFVILFGGFSFC